MINFKWKSTTGKIKLRTPIIIITVCRLHIIAKVDQDYYEHSAIPNPPCEIIGTLLSVICKYYKITYLHHFSKREMIPTKKSNTQGMFPSGIIINPVKLYVYRKWLHINQYY